ncbi:MAG: hypothetical protein ABSD68_00225 [Candidatus Micrarchaeales archaeon]
MQTRCSYIPEEKSITGRGKSIFGRVYLIFILFIAALFILAMLGSPGKHGEPPIIKNISPYFFGVLGGFGVAFIVGGWLEFQLMQTIDDIPTVKIDGASEGLNEISAQFIPEKGDALESLMSKQKCVYFVTTLLQYINAGKSSHWEACGSVSRGIPTLMTDGTGYLAVPLYEADLNMKAKSYFPVNVDGVGIRTSMPEGKEIMAIFQNDMAENELHDLGLEFQATGLGKGGLSGGNALMITELVLPMNTDYFVMGRVTDTDGMFNGKPVKRMSYDKATKILTVRSESKAGIEKMDKRLAFASFGFGALLLLGGLAYFGLT